MKTYKSKWHYNEAFSYETKDQLHGMLNFMNSNIGYYYKNNRKGFWLRIYKE